jgi:hypothetical protein
VQVLGKLRFFHGIQTLDYGAIFEHFFKIGSRLKGKLDEDYTMGMYNQQLNRTMQKHVAYAQLLNISAQ